VGIKTFLDLYQKPPPEHPCWIGGGILPKSGILLLGGWAKIGKTFLLLDAAHSLAAGGSLWGLNQFPVEEPTTVLFLEQEVGEYELQRRIKMRYGALDSDPPENLYYAAKDVRTGLVMLDTITGRQTLSRLVEESGAKIVIIDPVSRFMLGNENDNTQVGNVIRGLDDLVSQHKDLSVVLSHHFGKPPRVTDDDDDTFDPLSPYNFRGASKWFDAPDTLITMNRQKGRPGEWWRLTTGWRTRQAQEPEGTIKLVIKEGGLVEPVAQRSSLRPA